MRRRPFGSAFFTPNKNHAELRIFDWTYAMNDAGGEIKIWLLRLFAGSWATMFALAALLLKNFVPGFALWWLPLFATLFFAFGLFVPAVMRRPYRVVEGLLAPVGEVFAFLILGIVYYGVFTPFSLVLRLIGWDPLRRRRSRFSASAWVERNPSAADADYRWQY